MGLFNKVVKHSKSSKELDKKIKNFNEEFEKNKLISSKKMFSDEEIDEILSKNIELEYNEFDLNESGLSEIDKSIEDLSEKYKKNIIEKKSALDGKSKEIKKIFNELYKNEVENVVENYISKYSKDIVNLREDLFYEVQKKPTVNLNVLEDKINLLTIRYNQLSEGLLDGSYNNDLKNPINIEQLKNHYQLLVGRLQEQLATIGGGGEVNLKYLDDVVGIATNPSVYDGKYLKYDHSIGKFVFEDVSGVSSFSGDYNDLTNKPTIPSVVGLASEGYVDNAVSGVSTFSGDYNDLTNKPTIPSIVGLASEGYVDNAVGGITTFTGAATTITSNQISNWNTSYGWGDHGVVGYATEAVTNSLQAQINSLGTNLNIIGFYDAAIGVVTSLTVVGETRGYISAGNTLPSVGITTGDYLIISTGGNDVGIASYISLGITSAYPGDWIVGVGNSEWNILSYSQQVIAPRATNADFADTLKSDSSVNTSGIITAGSFYGNGANLSGVVTSLVGYATEGYVDNAVVGFVTSGSLVGYLTEEVDTLDSVCERGSALYYGQQQVLTDVRIVGTDGIKASFFGCGALGGSSQGDLTMRHNDSTHDSSIAHGNTLGDLTISSVSVIRLTAGSPSVNILTAGSTGVTINGNLNNVSGDATIIGSLTAGSVSVGGSVTANTFYGNFSGSITDATNLTGGYANASSLNVSGIATISQGRIQANADANLRFGNIAAGSGSSRNIAIGDQVLTSLSGGSGRNIGIGELSYYDTTSGQYNIGIGIQAGQKITSGSYNVILGGYNGQTGLDLRTSSNNVVLSDGQGNIRQYIDSSGNVGIKTTVVTEALTVAGIVSASSFYGTLNASQLTGILPAIDGSNLFGVTATGTGVEIRNDGTPVGTAGTINFADNINVTFGAGIATVSTSLVGYATEGYVDSSIVGFITSGALDGYATENYVSTASVAFASTAGIASALISTVNVNTSGIITASIFSGSASSLTNIPSAQLTGNLPAIDGSALLNVNATGEGIVVEDSGSNIGSARTVNFGTGLDVTYSASGIATVNASGGSLQSRTIVSGSTTSIANNGIGNTNIAGFKSYALMKVGLSTAGWLRIYTDSASRENDVSRSVGIDPTPGTGVIAEVVTTGISTTQIISPFVMGGNLDDPADTTIYASITNLSGTTQAITANLTILQLEA